ncbi:MFS transporter [Gilvimarinus sp. F26214L]|uniref:MFS transporter n=1 Tax=Gilvimarinus sp. DZF01 TaxID=3461371 RepID=UPI0040463E43
MKTVILSVTALFMSLALLVSGNAMLSTLISLRLDMEAVSDTTLGLVLAFYSLGFVLGATYGVNIIRQVGHIRAYAVYAALACATTLLHPLVVNAEAWMVMRLIIGFCLAGLMTVTESWINDRATNESRGKLLSVYTINFYLASSLGQLLVGLNNPAEFVAYTVVAMLVVMSLVPLSLTQSLIPTPPSHHAALGMRDLAKHAPSGLTGALISGLSLGAFVALGPVYASRAGLPLTEISRYMGFTIVCAILLQWPAGWLSDQKGRLPVLVGLLLVGALTAGGAALVGQQSTVALFGLSGAFFALTASIYPISVALTNDNLPQDQLVAACATMLRVYGIGTMAGPLLIAFLMGVIGDAALFSMISAAMLAGATLIQWVFHKGDEVPLEDQVEFVTTNPISTPVLTEIDPRNEEFEQHHPGEPAEWDIADKLEMLMPDPEELHEEAGEPVDGEAVLEPEDEESRPA